MLTQEWHEVTCKDWDKLADSEREIFLTPICGRPKNTKNSLRVCFAGTQQSINRLDIRSLRLINS